MNVSSKKHVLLRERFFRITLWNMIIYISVKLHALWVLLSSNEGNPTSIQEGCLIQLPPLLDSLIIKKLFLLYDPSHTPFLELGAYIYRFGGHCQRLTLSSVSIGLTESPWTVVKILHPDSNHIARSTRKHVSQSVGEVNKIGQSVQRVKQEAGGWDFEIELRVQWIKSRN